MLKFTVRESGNKSDCKTRKGINSRIKQLKMSALVTFIVFSAALKRNVVSILLNCVGNSTFLLFKRNFQALVWKSRAWKIEACLLEIRFYILVHEMIHQGSQWRRIVAAGKDTRRQHNAIVPAAKNAKKIYIYIYIYMYHGRKERKKGEKGGAFVRITTKSRSR